MAEITASFIVSDKGCQILYLNKKRYLSVTSNYKKYVCCALRPTIDVKAIMIALAQLQWPKAQLQWPFQFNGIQY